ncbi:MAG: HNH endonuclease signature motif containing protein [Acidimicrobiia bacterium]|nr:HNH endonuclease signature motif containing protein [Acidimicrobiia bacterium]MDX2467980.1 HNH endonuclease signature motif containing protein [Acidimicrobiia bacterium]
MIVIQESGMSPIGNNDPVLQIRLGVATLAGEHRTGWSGSSQSGRVVELLDAHHIVGWVKSLGETNIDNLILLCRRHHTLVHNSRWTITRTVDGEFEFTHPARGP